MRNALSPTRREAREVAAECAQQAMGADPPGADGTALSDGLRVSHDLLHCQRSTRQLRTP